MDKEDLKRLVEIVFERIFEGRPLRADQALLLMEKEFIEELREQIMWFIRIHTQS